MDLSNPFTRLISDPASLATDVLRKLYADYPYSPLPAIALLEYHLGELDETEIKKFRLHLALICGDKEALFNILGERHNEFADLYPPSYSQPQSSTESAIDTFFANYGSADPAETELLERMIFNPVPDYAEVLIREEDLDDSEDSLPSASSALKTDAPAEKPILGKTLPKNSPPPPDDTLLSESLAKIFIKQGRYERAYEIISNLSLNYPKKSIYFADQLRFLQKLIKIKQAANGQ